MATPILQASPGNFNFGPMILPQSQGDLEEARIKRLLELAKLAELQQGPLIQREQLNLQQRRQQLDERGQERTNQHLTAEEQNWANMFGLNTQKFGEDVRQFDTKLGAEDTQQQRALKEDLQKTFLHALVNNTGAVSQDTIAKLATASGLPDFAGALTTTNVDPKQAAFEDALRKSGKLPPKPAQVERTNFERNFSSMVIPEGPRATKPTRPVFDTMVPKRTQILPATPGYDTVSNPTATVMTPTISAPPVVQPPTSQGNNANNPAAFMQNWLMRLLHGAASANWRPPV